MLGTMMRGAIARTAIWVACLAICLFLPARTLAWPFAWAVLLAYVSIVEVAFVTVDPELLRERARPSQGFDRGDAIIAGIGALLLYPATLATAGLDYSRDWSPALPAAVQVVGLGIFIAGYALALWAMRTNPFFTTFVRIQQERGHHLIDRGPYAWVRHPGYTGTLTAHLALPIALGSLWALAPAVMGCLIFMVRTVREDQTLTDNLTGYAEYRDRVRWRLVPGVW